MPTSPLSSGSNKFCALADLSNEASVEQFFVNRLLSDLGYRDSQIAPKQSLSTHSVSLGRRRVNYRPDYALKVRNRVRWICDAKAVNESLDDWVGQCASYCLELNRGESDNPVEFYLLTNGATTRVYRWDSDVPVLSLQFTDFVDGNAMFDRLRDLLGVGAFSTRNRAVTRRPSEGMVTLHRKSVSELNADFAWAHRYIYRRENLSYSAAFMEFVKVIFLKLLSDREVHASSDAVINEAGEISVAASEVRFSRRWIEDRERDHPNPLDALQFQRLLQGLETEIRQGTKKRIFRTDERLDLSNETIKAIAERLQGTDLFGIDADLNGRLFETFLNATLRGRALGQYFTPRSVVKLATRMARLQAGPDGIDTVLDACCGTGGFLIEALAEMWRAIDTNSSLTQHQREELKLEVATQRLFGVDIARDPALARIARINMYLHGDGGSRIYQLDALDKRVRETSNDSLEIAGEKLEFRELLASDPEGLADVVLTNPPFAKEYSRDQEPEALLLDDYELGFEGEGGARRPIQTLRSSVMFLERYYDLLRPGGQLLTIIDDGILGSDSYGAARSWLRKRFLIRAVISLPGDAFQRSQARVKTSLIVLEKKRHEEDAQPAVFMYYCTAVGVDDSPRQRVLPIDEVNRQRAVEEIERVLDLYEDFRSGRQDAAAWSVPATAIADRMDVKAVLPQAARRLPDWARSGLEVKALSALLEPVYGRGTSEIRPEGVIDTQQVDDLVTHLRVRYEGFAEAGDEVATGDSNSRYLYRVHAGDLVFSHINAIHGAVAVVPPELEGLVVTNEYTVCRPLNNIDPRIVWALVRSPEARADLLLLSTGIGRTRIDWNHAARLQLPLPPAKLQDEIVRQVVEAEEAERHAEDLRAQAQRRVLDELLMDSETAKAIIAAFKPPR